MPAARGSVPLTGFRWGDQFITQVRRGDQIIWVATTMLDAFDRPGPDLGALWVPEGNSGVYNATIINGDYARLYIPEGLISESNRRAQHRFVGAVMPEDNGFLRVRVATRGDDSDALHTTAWSRLSNTGFTHGIGIELRAGSLYITRKVAGTDQQMTYCGAYTEGDDLYLDHNARVHTLYRNGRFVGTWEDLGATAAMGVAYRSMGLTFRGIKGFLGPRRFSAGIDYIECG